MSKNPTFVGVFQLAVLKCVSELNEKSTLTIMNELKCRSGEDFSPPQLSGALIRLKERGLIEYVRSIHSNSKGRPVHVFKLTKAGQEMIDRANKYLGIK